MKSPGRHTSRTLYWNGVSGNATLRLSLDLQLRKAPKINGRLVEQIDYMPVVGIAQVLWDGHKKWAELTPTEQAWIDDALVASTRAGLAPWE